MLGKLLSMVVTSGANNPWRPTNQEQFDEMVADKDKIGSYIEYDNQTYRVDEAHIEGHIAANEPVNQINGQYVVAYDSSKKPQSYRGSVDVTGIQLLTGYVTMKAKYLMVSDDTVTIGNNNVSVRKGLMLLISENTYSNFALVFVSGDNEYDAYYDHNLLIMQDKWAEGMYIGCGTEAFTPTFVLDNAAYEWNGRKKGFIGKTYVQQSAQKYYPYTSNPLKPTTQEEYDELLTPDNVGSFFDYNNKITRYNGVLYSGTFAVNDSISAVYFDTTKTPTIPDFTTDYEEISGAKVKYLFKMPGTSEAIGGASCGLLFAQDSSSDEDCHILYFISTDGAYPIWSDCEIEGKIGWVLEFFGQENPYGVILSTPETITSVTADYNWNGVYVFKNREVQIDEYIKATN